MAALPVAVVVVAALTAVVLIVAATVTNHPGVQGAGRGARYTLTESLARPRRRRRRPTGPREAP